MRGRVTSDKSGICLGAIDSRSHLWIVRCWGVQKRSEEVVNAVLDLCEAYPIERIGFESQAWEAIEYIVLAEVAKRETARGERIYIPTICEIPVGRDQSKNDRINARLGALVRTNQISIQRDQTELIDQMNDFPSGRYDDLIDATDMMYPLIKGHFHTSFGDSQRYIASSGVVDTLAGILSRAKQKLSTKRDPQFKRPV